MSNEQVKAIAAAAFKAGYYILAADMSDVLSAVDQETCIALHTDAIRFYATASRLLEDATGERADLITLLNQLKGVQNGKTEIHEAH